MNARLLLVAACIALVPACGGDDDDSADTGTAQIFVEAEETIPEGLTPGDGEENIKDGWTVTYDKFLIAFTGFHAGRSAAPDDVLEQDGAVVLDLTGLPTSGFVLAEFPSASATRYDEVSYDTPVVTSTTTRDPSADEADVQAMIDNGWSQLLAGTLTKDDGESCLPTDPTDCAPATSIHFEWGLTAPTSYEGCGPEEGDLGFAVPTGGTAQVNLTIHGDHLWFNNFPEGVEVTDRLVQWAANCDLDRDGEVTVDELEQTQAGDVFPATTYSLAGAPYPVETALDFVRSQQSTIGHLQGEGECVWVVE